MRIKLRDGNVLAGPHGHEVAVLKSFRPMKSGSRTSFTGWQLRSRGTSCHGGAGQQPLHHFRKELWALKLLTRQRYDVWEADGAKDMAQRVRERVREIVENHEVPPLPDETVAALEKLRRQGEEELTRE